MATLWRGLLHGLAFGLAAGTVDLWFGMIPVVTRRLAAGPGFLVRTLLLEIALGALLGLVTAPLLRVRFGRVVHLVSVALIWAGLVKWVELDSPIFTSVQYAPFHWVWSPSTVANSPKSIEKLLGIPSLMSRSVAE